MTFRQRTALVTPLVAATGATAALGMHELLRLRRDCGFRLLFHDTHYRILTQPVRMARLGLERCDAILAYSPSLAAAYRDTLGLSAADVHVFHEGADTAVWLA